MQTPEDRFYNPTRINGWFAISSVLVAVATIAVILADHYDREWKGYQQGFHELEKKNAETLLALRSTQSAAFSEEARGLANLLLRGDRASSEGPSSLDKDAFERHLAEAKKEAEFPAGAVLAARAYVDEAAKLEQGETFEKRKALLEEKRDEAEAKRFKAEKEQRELQGMVDELKFRKDHALAHGHEAEAAAVVKEYDLTFAREKKVHSDMDAFALEKSRILDGKRALYGEVTARRDRARRLDELSGVAGAEKRLDSFVIERLREIPLLDFPAPVKRIEQKVFPDLTVDYNFAQIGRVDRCMTCHTGIDKVRVDPDTGDVTPLYTAANTPEKVHRTHPRPDLYVAFQKHSIDKVGCTVCHEGLGWGLSFTDAFHTPNTPEQEEEWERKYHWHKGESWDFPMLPMKHIEASCFKCHRDQAQLPPEDKFAKEIPSAPSWNRGMRIVERQGCFGCHKIDGFSVPGLDKWLAEVPEPDRAGWARAVSVRKPGPSLLRVASKWTSKERAWKWIWDPRAFRPTTNMPRFFGQPNNNGVDPLTGHDYDMRTRTEVWGIVEALWSRSAGREPAFVPEKAPVPGDAARGKELFGGPTGVGCLACHSTKDFPNPTGGPVNDFGPELSTMGSKASEAWIYDWIRNPDHYWDGTRMPSLRLTEQEAADLAAYLSSLRDEAWEKDAPQPANEAMVRSLAIEAVRATAKPAENPVEIVEGMTPGQRLETIGVAAVKKYACFGCHEIQGWETAERIGTELGGGEAWGSKDVDRLDFGRLEDPAAVKTYEKGWGAKLLPHRKPEWVRMKLLNPRVFDAGMTKQPHEQLLMPNFSFTEAEADDVVTFLLSLQRGEIPGTKRRLRDSREILAEKMKWIARQYNCYGCHQVTAEERIEDGEHVLRPRGRDIEPWLDQDRTDYWPPALGGQVVKVVDEKTGKESRVVAPGEGSRVQPQWLFGFLRDPGKQVLRFWMPTRMPTFGFTQQELNAVVHGFAAQDGVPFPFEFRQAGSLEGKALEEAKEYFRVLDCAKCHPAKGQDTGPQSGLAPDLSFAHDRLRYDWVVRWIDSPMQIMPGTAMPARWRSGADSSVLTPPDLGDNKRKYFGDDPHEQIRRIAEYVFWLGAPKD